MDTTNWVCPNMPFGHDWNGGLSCRGCDATRTAADAITSLLAGPEGWDQSRAAALVSQHRLQVISENSPQPPSVSTSTPSRTVIPRKRVVIGIDQTCTLTRPAPPPARAARPGRSCRCPAAAAPAA